MTDNLDAMYADISACMLALCNALDAKGLLSKAEMSEAFQEHLLAMQPSGEADELSPYPFPLLRLLATGLNTSPPR